MKKRWTIIVVAVAAAVSVTGLVLLLGGRQPVVRASTVNAQLAYAAAHPEPHTFPADAIGGGLLPVEARTPEQFLSTVTSTTAPDDWLVYDQNMRTAAANLPGLHPSIIIATWPTGSDPRAQLAQTGRPFTSPADTPWYAVAAPTSGGSHINPASPWVLFVFPLLLVAVIITAQWLMTRKMRGSARTFTTHDGEQSAVPPTRFSDLAGADEAVDEMRELVDMLANPGTYRTAGVSTPHGVLLSGPPGTGKTLLARAVAGEAGVPFYAVSGADFVEMFVGVGAARVRSLFKKARTHPGGAIIFIDEIDSLGRARTARADGSGSSEQEAALNTLLVELDGFTQDSAIMVIAATNRDDLLDAALTRPGRLERHITVGLPDRRGRQRIVELHVASKGVLLDDTVDLVEVARSTAGMSGAQLERVVNDAALTAARERRTAVTGADLHGAIAEAHLGKARTSMLITDADRTLTAWHEAGHTVAALVLDAVPDPVSVTIIPRGHTGGATWMSSHDSMYTTRAEAYGRLVMLMGGRAAEEAQLDGDYSSGPHGDLNAATRLAYAMLTNFGMVDGTLVSRGDASMEQVFAVDKKLRKQVNTLLSDALDQARALLRDERELLAAIAEALIDHNTLDSAALHRLAAHHRAQVVTT